MYNTKKLMHIPAVKNDQRGMVAIMVTVILMLVVSLIVLGFAQVSRRNQRIALDRQLSTQAYYAAESGINDAVSWLQKNSTYTTTSTDAETCNTINTKSGFSVNKLDSGGVAYTCLLVNNHPPELIRSNLAPGSNVVWPLKSSNGLNIATLDFSWRVDGATGTCTRNIADFPSIANYDAAGTGCNVPMLRVDLVRYTGGAATGQSLVDNTVSFYMQPKTAGTIANNTPQLTSTTANKAVISQCQVVAGVCTVTVNVSLLGSASYYTRITTLYKTANSVNVRGTLSDGTVAQFSGAVAQVDSTGKAQDQLRRIQVQVPLTGGGNPVPLPTSALQSTSAICKYFVTVPGDATATPPSLCTP